MTSPLAGAPALEAHFTECERASAPMEKRTNGIWGRHYGCPEAFFLCVSTVFQSSRLAMENPSVTVFGFSAGVGRTQRVPPTSVPLQEEVLRFLPQQQRGGPAWSHSDTKDFSTSSDLSWLAYCCCIGVIACGSGLFHMAHASCILSSVHVNIILGTHTLCVSACLPPRRALRYAQKRTHRLVSQFVQTCQEIVKWERSSRIPEHHHCECYLL